jgi:ABC-2 type transport system ATP-binding protein
MYAIRWAHDRVDDLIKRFDLQELAHRSLYSLSTGQQVRASLAKAFLNSPQLLLLDEPTASLDPDVADRVRGFLMNLVKDEGTTVFLTSHNMNEVSQICTRVLFLNSGKIQAEGTPKELARRIKRSRLHLRSKKAFTDLPALHVPGAASLRVEGHELFIEAEATDMGPILNQLTQALIIESITIQEPTLEDFFVQTVRQDAK